MIISSNKTCSIIEALSLSPRELITLVGGGGKSTLMSALAEEARNAGLKAVATTTTKVRGVEAQGIGKVVYWSCDNVSLEKLLGRCPGLFIGSEGVEDGKIGGIKPETADTLFLKYPLDFLIVEADGAAGRPLKAPAAHEPVIPSSTTLVVAVIGLEALGRPVSEELVFRTERFEAVTGLKPGEIITAESILPLFFLESGLFKSSPSGARKAVFLNKADLMNDAEAMVSLAKMILGGSSCQLERVVAGSIAGKSFEVFLGGGEEIG
ncbi:MAG: selenium cofactor biosynthesis protein YqeC [Desulfatiglandaceae bacterium]